MILGLSWFEKSPKTGFSGKIPKTGKCRVAKKKFFFGQQKKHAFLGFVTCRTQW
jgi:hypothetical protein